MLIRCKKTKMVHTEMLSIPCGLKVNGCNFSNWVPLLPKLNSVWVTHSKLLYFKNKCFHVQINMQTQTINVIIVPMV